MEDDREELVQVQNDNCNIIELEGRHRQVRELEDDIVTINEIYKRMADIVEDQGDMVTSIEMNIENTSVQVTEGTEQLRQAGTFKSRIRKKKFCLCGTLLVIAGIIALVIILKIIKRKE